MGNDIFGMHKHHIIFKSQGGLDFPLNLVELTMEEHLGNSGPHLNSDRDKELKLNLQNQLWGLFPEDGLFTIEEISERLGRTERYFEPHFRKVPLTEGKYRGYDIVKKLMGGKFVAVPQDCVSHTAWK